VVAAALVASALAPPWGAGVAAADAIQPGDVLRVEIFEAPELGREAARVGVDGRIALPKIGLVAVGGVDVDAARRLIETVLIESSLMRAPTVLVEVATHRPVYVGGAVARPGAVPFEFGLTARHAVILAGGLDRSAGGDRLNTVELIGLKAKWRAQTYELFQIDSQIAMLEAELAAASAPDFPERTVLAVPEETAVSVLHLQSDQFRDRMADRAARAAHLEDLISLGDLEIDLLTRQGQLQQEAEEIQREQLESSRSLFERGVLPLPRLQALQFDLSRISRDILANRAYVAQARQGNETRRYERASGETRRRLDLRRELLDARVMRAAREAELEIVAATLLSAGVRLTDDAALTEPEPEVTVFRLRGGKQERFSASMEAAILPGDVLEVSVAQWREGS
jgi:polysaccharide export outer membrane protein